MKPEPKQEIKIITPEQTPSMLLIFVASADAGEWIAREAPAFGKYFPPINDPWHVLHVSPVYDVNEVRQYLETQGQGSK